MFLYRFFQRLSQDMSFGFVSENEPGHANEDQVYGSALPQTLTSTSAKVVCRAPIRTFDLQEHDLDGISQKRIFHLRDPRDILVSEYFSFGWIHPDERHELTDRRNQIQEMSIDDYVLRQAEECTWPLNEKYEPLETYEFVSGQDLVVKYEQMVCSFYSWCRCIVEFMGVKNPTWTTIRLAWRYRNEFRSRGESLKHKRRITPGDHKEKLKPKTIDRLNQRFEIILKRFGYLQ